MFSCEFYKVFKNTFFTEHLWWLLLLVVSIPTLKFLDEGILKQKIWLNILFDLLASYKDYESLLVLEMRMSFMTKTFYECLLRDAWVLGKAGLLLVSLILSSSK